jgi:hypothetical protein
MKQSTTTYSNAQDTQKQGVNFGAPLTDRHLSPRNCSETKKHGQHSSSTSMPCTVLRRVLDSCRQQALQRRNNTNSRAHTLLFHFNLLRPLSYNSHEITLQLTRYTTYAKMAIVKVRHMLGIYSCPRGHVQIGINHNNN